MNGPFEYVERRLEPQRKWHNEKATWNKRRFYTAEVATLLAGAAIPIVNLWVVKDPYWAGLLSAILGGVVVVAASVGKLFKFHENWLQYRTLVEALEREKELYSVGAGDYAELDEAGRNRLLWNVSKAFSPAPRRNSFRLTKVRRRNMVDRKC
jgi:hypothetical protein